MLIDLARFCSFVDRWTETGLILKPNYNRSHSLAITAAKCLCETFIVAKCSNETGLYSIIRNLIAAKIYLKKKKKLKLKILLHEIILLKVTKNGSKR